jgi:hypothetical protein
MALSLSVILNLESRRHSCKVTMMEKSGDSTWTQLSFTPLVMTIKLKNGTQMRENALEQLL